MDHPCLYMVHVGLLQVLLFRDDVPDEVIGGDVPSGQVDTVCCKVRVDDVEVGSSKLVLFQGLCNLCIEVSVGRNVGVSVDDTVGLPFELDKFSFSGELC